jgi:hypothetical protein
MARSEKAEGQNVSGATESEKVGSISTREKDRERNKPIAVSTIIR